MIRFAMLTVALALPVCASPGISDDDGERERLEDARRLWRSQGWDSYAFTLRRTCFCLGGTDPAEVVVRNGARVSVTDVQTGEPVPSEFARYYLTVDELFDFILDAIDRKAALVEVGYDPGAGYPRSVWIDYDERAADEEMGFQASDLRALR